MRLSFQCLPALKVTSLTHFQPSRASSQVQHFFSRSLPLFCAILAINKRPTTYPKIRQLALTITASASQTDAALGRAEKSVTGLRSFVWGVSGRRVGAVTCATRSSVALPFRYLDGEIIAGEDGRDELGTLLEFIGAGDVLVCVKLDRLGRSTRDVLNLVHELDQKSASLRVLGPAISTDGPMGKMVLTGLGMVAEMEPGFIKARQREGIERAKSLGDVYKGRKPTIDPLVVRELFDQGVGASEIARRLKIGHASVYRVLGQ
jgi:hypothetical protein